MFQNEQAPQTIANLRTIKAIARMATIAAASDESRNEYTIDDLMNIEGITDFEILKIDIEGSCPFHLNLLDSFLEEIQS